MERLEELDQVLGAAYKSAFDFVKKSRHDFFTVEHLLYKLMQHSSVRATSKHCCTEKAKKFERALGDYLAENIEVVPSHIEYEVLESAGLAAFFRKCKELKKEYLEKDSVDGRALSYTDVFVYISSQWESAESVDDAVSIYQDIFGMDGVRTFCTTILEDSLEEKLSEVAKQFGEYSENPESGTSESEKKSKKSQGEVEYELETKDDGMYGGSKSKETVDENVELRNSGDRDRRIRGRIEVHAINAEDLPFDVNEMLRGIVSHKKSEGGGFFEEISVSKSRHEKIVKERSDELDQIRHILCCKDLKNVVLVGENGVGKSFMGRCVASEIQNGILSAVVPGVKLYNVDFSRLASGVVPGESQEKVCHEIGRIIEQNPQGVVLFIDDICTSVSSLRVEILTDAIQTLRPFLGLPRVWFVVTATPDEYLKELSSNKLIMKFFKKVDVKQLAGNKLLEVLKMESKTYAAYHNVTIPVDVLKYTVDLCGSESFEVGMPAGALRLVDEAAVVALLNNGKEASRPRVAKSDIDAVLVKRRMQQGTSFGNGESQKDVFRTLSESMKAKIYGQDEAIDKVCEAVLLGKAGLADPNKPLASLFFVGPTGVGKTEVAKELSNQLGVKLVRFDMSEFSEKHNVAKFIGSPAGYVGYDDGGLLTNAVRANPQAVLLFDEVEKAHPDIYNVLLQVLDYATLTDSKGIKVDFSKCIILFTSNAGAQFAKQAKLGFGSTVTEGSAMLSEVKKLFKPEFINRLTAMVVFNNMTREMAKLIVEAHVKVIVERVAKRGITVDVTPEAIEELLTLGYSAEYGAREIDRVLNSNVNNILAKEILYGSLSKKAKKAVIDYDDNKFVVKIAK